MLPKHNALHVSYMYVYRASKEMCADQDIGHSSVCHGVANIKGDGGQTCREELQVELKSLQSASSSTEPQQAALLTGMQHKTLLPDTMLVSFNAALQVSLNLLCVLRMCLFLLPPPNLSH